jgi:hypothetical protein
MNLTIAILMATAQGDGGGGGGGGPGDDPSGPNKRIHVVSDTSYRRAAQAEGFVPRDHLLSYMNPVRSYLSDRNRFYLTFNRGLSFGEWETPRRNSPATRFTETLASGVFAGRSTSWAIVVGVTGKPTRDPVLGRAAGVSDATLYRHCVIFYPPHLEDARDNRRGRFELLRQTAAHEIGHLFSAEHHESAYVRKNRPCAMSLGDILNSDVYKFCSNHESLIYAYQRSRRGQW